MAETEKEIEKKRSAEWFFRGVLIRLGDTFDRLTGRRWSPSSSLAASELIAKLTNLLDEESIVVVGKGTVVPHNIKLKIQWDKFSTDSDALLRTLENELLTAAIDHINDKLYYTYAPLVLEVRPDYFVSGVKLFAGFEKFAEEKEGAELNVSIPNIKTGTIAPSNASPKKQQVPTLVARFELNNEKKTSKIRFPSSERISVGRTSQNDLMLQDPSVSKIHASLSINAEGLFMVADTGSTNGTFVNENRIPYGQPVIIEDNKKVKFGNVVVELEMLREVQNTTTGFETNDSLVDQSDDERENAQLALSEAIEAIEIGKTLDLGEEEKDSTIK